MDLSNYWDDFQIRVNNTIVCMRTNKLPSLQRLTVHLTNACNFHCEYCNMRFNGKTMHADLVRKIVDDYVSANGSIIHFTGGEPSIVPYIETLFEYAHSAGLVVSTNSNCYIQMNTTYIDKMKASFDTCNKDAFNATMGKKCFDEVVSTLKHYSQTMQDKMLSITAVLNKKTYETMLSLAKFVQENFKVYNLYYSNYKGCNPAFAFSDEEIKDMFENYIPSVLKYFKDTGNQYSYNQLSLYKPNDFINEVERFAENKVIPCYIQLSEMTVDVDGNCYNCSHLYRDGVKPFKMYNVNDMSLKECFDNLKRDMNGMYCGLSDKCLSGCNRNLIGFNKAVYKDRFIY